MANTTSNNTGKVLGALLLGAVVGGAVGTVLGVLFAPEKGTETQKRILEKGEDLANGIKGKFNDFLENAKTELETGKEKVCSYAGNGKGKAEEVNSHTV